MPPHYLVEVEKDATDKEGEVSSCDILFAEDIEMIHLQYMEYKKTESTTKGRESPVIDDFFFEK